MLYSQYLSEFVCTCAQGIRANSSVIYSQWSETPSLPILPSLPLVLFSLVPCALPPFVPSCLSGYASIMQNKPNFLKAKTTVTLCAEKIYSTIAFRPMCKNKPN